MFVTMVIAALIVDGIFSALGLIPGRTAPDPRRHLHRDPRRLQARAQRPRRRHLRRPVHAHRSPGSDRPGVRDEGRPRQGGDEGDRRCRRSTSAPPTASMRSKQIRARTGAGPPPDPATTRTPPMSIPEQTERNPMTVRGTQLQLTAGTQITKLIALVSTADASALGRPCAGRAKLGDRTVAASVQHTADNYRRIAGFVASPSPDAPAPGRTTTATPRTGWTSARWLRNSRPPAPRSAAWPSSPTPNLTRCHRAAHSGSATGNGRSPRS